MKREISPVQSREDKRLTYQKHLQQYKRAMKNEFYFEAILIDYACLEDRLRYMLYYLGVLKGEMDYKVTAPDSIRVKAFRSILHRYEDPNANMIISSISGKCRIIKSIFSLVADPAGQNKDQEIEKLLCDKLNDQERVQQIIGLLARIGKWCGYRNEIIHSLMNKNLESLKAHIKEKADEGYQLFRQLDNHVSWVKRKGIRGKLKLKQ